MIRVLPTLALAALLTIPVIVRAQDGKAAAPTIAEIYARTRASVVTIEMPTGHGSGIVIDENGIIATSLHVVRNDPAVTIRLPNGEAYDDVRVIDVDARRDLALLKVKGERFQAARVGDSDTLEVGDRVYAIGSPRGLAQTVSEGIVSAKREVNGFWAIQTMAPISPGSSGGGLFDSQGRLIGLTYMQVTTTGNLNFAVPVNYLRPLRQTPGTFSLSELRSKLPPQVARLGPGVSDLSAIPRLSTIYSTDGGTLALIEQRGSRLRVTFRSRAGEVTGNAELTWNQDLEAFDGSGQVTASCGRKSSQMRTSDAPLSFPQLFVIDERVLRTRWLQPTEMDCRLGQVKASAWREEIWVTRAERRP